MWNEANSLIRPFFGSVKKARKELKGAEQVPESFSRPPLPMTDMEQASQPIVEIWKNMDDVKKEKVRTLIDTYYDRWKACYKARRQYHMHCLDDEAHTMAYRRYKYATFVSKVIRMHEQ